MFLSRNTEQLDIVVELDHFHSKREHLKFRPHYYLSRVSSVCQNKSWDSNFEQNRTISCQISSFSSKFIVNLSLSNYMIQL